MKIFSELKRVTQELNKYDGSWALCGGIKSLRESLCATSVALPTLCGFLKKEESSGKTRYRWIYLCMKTTEISENHRDYTEGGISSVSTTLPSPPKDESNEIICLIKDTPTGKLPISSEVTRSF